MHEEKEERTKQKFFSLLIFSKVRRITETLGVHFILEYLGVLYHSIVVISELLQDAILNLPNPYLISTCTTALMCSYTEGWPSLTMYKSYC